MRQVEDLTKRMRLHLHTNRLVSKENVGFFFSEVKKNVRNDGFYLFDRGRDYCNTIGKHINTIFAFALLARVNVRTHIT